MAFQFDEQMILEEGLSLETMPIRVINVQDDQHQEPIKKPDDGAIFDKMKTFSSKKNFTLKLKFEIDKPNQAKRSIGANTLYSPNKGNSYFLIDINKIDKDKSWIIHTNNYRFNNIEEYSFISEKEYPNNRFL